MRIVAISDTHMKHGKISLPDGDILIHAGDSLNSGSMTELQLFIPWIQQQSHKHKILIAGNHDWAFARDPSESRKLCEDSGIILLHDQEVIIDGVKFYGSPYQPEFCGWAFNLPKGQALKEVWDKIPIDTDILITHGPPYGILDVVNNLYSSNNGQSVGCEELRKAVDSLKLKKHFFGHIHCGHGSMFSQNTEFLNVAICDERYRPVNPVTIVDL